MSFDPKDSISPFLSDNLNWPSPSDEKDFNYRMQQSYRSISSYLNQREIANYMGVTPSGSAGTDVTELEVVTGQQWFGSGSDSQNIVPRMTFRKVINFGTLPNAGSKSVAHGLVMDLALDSNTTFTRILGAATDPTALSFLPLPFASPTLNQNISLSVDATNVTVTTGIDRTAYTRAIIVIEYLRNL